jgi:probable HAF family extracellular repeat protein
MARCESDRVGGRGSGFAGDWRAAPWLGLLPVLWSSGIGFAAAQGYTVTDLGTLGGSTSSARAVNASGQVTGSADLPGDAVSHAFLWENGAMRDLSPPGGGPSTALGINAAGSVVGFFSASGITDSHAFLADAGGMHDLGTFGGNSGAAFGINDAGWIVGAANWPAGGLLHCFIDTGSGMRSPTGDWRSTQSIAFAINASGQTIGRAALPFQAFHAVRFDPSGPHDLGTLGGSYSEAYDINDAGQIVGDSELSLFNGPLHAFLFDSQGMHDLGTLGGTDFSVAAGINSAGQIVGYSRVPGIGLSHALLYDHGILADLNDMLSPGSGWTLIKATSINDRGQIVGEGVHNGQWHAYLLNPPAPPAPSGLAATVVSGSQVFLSWTDNSGDETAFALWRQTGANAFARIGVLTPNSTSVMDSGVSAGTSYTYAVRAIGLGGASAWSNQATVTPATPPLSPPTFLRATMAHRAQIQISWTDNSSNETAFAIWRKAGNGAYTRVGVVPPNRPTFTDIGVNPSTLYTYRVRATNDTVASVWSSEVSVLTPAKPAAPSLLTVTAAGQQTTVQWTNNTHIATAVEVYRRQAGSGGPTLVAVLPPDRSTYTDTGLIPNTPYYYHVRAANDYFASYSSGEYLVRSAP